VLLIQFMALSYIIYDFLERRVTAGSLERFEKHATRITQVWGLVLLLLVLRRFLDPLQTFLRIAVVVWIFEVVKSTLENRRQEKSQVMLYEVFSFINNQLSAGIRLEDVIGNIHRVVEDRRFKRVFREGGEIFKANYDLELYLKALGRHFEPEEFFYVAYSLRNGFNLGLQKELLKYQEEIMFNNYIGTLIKKGDRGQIKLFFIALVQAAVLVVFLAYPILVELMGSLAYLF
jgi:Flp pilus assembly protein TadB